MLIEICLIFGSILFYWYGTRTFDYWKVRGVKHDRAYPFVGTNLKQFMLKASVGMAANEMYNKYPDEKVVGFYRAFSPELVVRDPEIAKQILLADFNSFHSRRLYPHRTQVEPMLRNLFMTDGDVWRLLRQRLSPLFSTGKLKAMFHLIIKRAEKLQQITEEVTEKDFYDARELMARYTTDFIGECGFGICMDTLSEENNQFRRLGKRMFIRTPMDIISFAVKFIFPEITTNINIVPREVEESIIQIVQSVIKERNRKSSGRNDFIDLMLEIMEKGQMVGESLDLKNHDGSPKVVAFELDDILLAAQVFVFFGAGFETSSTASSYILHQLAYNPNIQLKIQNEIDKVLKRYDNKLSYEAIKEMKYLEMTFYEGLRMYPSVAYLVRACSVPEFNFPELNLTITEGVKMFIPIAAIQNDEKYFPNPGQFDPDRFADGAKEYIKKGVFLPFGEGPRSCIAARLGQMQTMAGLAAVLQKFSVEPAACSKRVPEPDRGGLITEGFEGGLPLKFKRRFAQ